MNAVEIYEMAQRSLNRNEITVGEFEKQIAVLKDVEPVVRCKDCKHSEPCGESRQCLHPFGLNACDGNDFCSYGERRNDGKSTSA